MNEQTAATERQRAFLEACIRAYRTAYTDYFAPDGYHEMVLQMWRDLQVLPPRSE